MVFNLSISSSDDEETPALTPVASPRASSGCVGVIRRFDGPGLQDRSRDRGAVGQMQDENPLGSNDSAGKNTRPGSPLAWPSPPASPQASICCVSIISRFDGLLLQHRSRDTGAVGQMQDENPLGSNDSAGKVYGKKLVVKVDFYDDRGKRKAMQVVSTFKGIGSLSWDLKDSKLTVSGDFDPAKLVNKMRKSWPTDIVSVGPAEEDDGKKDGGKKEEDKKDDLIANLIKAYEAYHPTPVTYYYVPQEGTPNCVIC